MSKGRQLYELQEIDLEIETKSAELSLAQSRLGESKAVAEARVSLASEQESLVELQRNQRLGEWEIEDLRSKIAVLEDRLYGGSVRNPKELASIQEQVKNLKRGRAALEDKVLDIMAEVEMMQQRLAVSGGELDRLEQNWREEQASLAREHAELSAALATLDQRRKGLVSRIDAASLALYDELRDKRQGRAVAKVERGMCQGCRIVLPMSELQRARMGQELVQCSSCERILYVS